jgi:thiamine-phosphate diphosphorylase
MMFLDRPIICLVTDRRRLVGGDDRFAAARASLAELARHAVSAGVDLIQIRERDLQTAQLVDVVGDLADIARGSPTRVVVNDRPDVALACRAGGVHLRSDSIPPAAARSVAGPGLLIGRSVHTIDEAVEHQSAVDYLIAGTVFPTASKPTAECLLGEDGLSRIIEAVSVPVLAIGGVTVGRAARIAVTGASGVAGIGLFLTAASSMTDVVAAVRAQFGTIRAAS